MEPTTTSDPPAALLDRLNTGEVRAALTFAGQGVPALPGLAALLDRQPDLRDHVDHADRVLDRLVRSPAGVASGRFRYGYRVRDWVDDPGAAPTERYLRSCAVSCPLVLLTQLLTWEDLRRRGLGAAVAVAGHSQGLLAALAVAEDPTAPMDGQRLARHLEIAFHQGLHQATATVPVDERTAGPMVAVRGLRVDRATELLATTGATRDVTVALVNAPDSIVLSGPPPALARLKARFLQPGVQWDVLPVDVPHHSPALAGARDRHHTWLGTGPWLPAPGDLHLPVLSPDSAQDLREEPDAASLAAAVSRSQFTSPVRWDRVVRALTQRGAAWILDLGPGTGVARLTGRNLQGTGARSLALESPEGLRNLTISGAAPTTRGPVYEDLAPGLVQLPDGRTRIDNRYTRITGQPPVILPGMTPTTADVPIVAAAARAGYTAELAGGGQRRPRILTERMAELAENLDGSAGAVFNTLYMDRALWATQIGDPAGTGQIFRMKEEGAPIVGVTVSAGVPPVDEAVALLDALTRAGMVHNAFKPGTAEQVRQVLAIADAAPHHTVIMHVEGGKAGGHHSHEDLESLLLATYHDVRRRGNTVLCAGGGVGTPQRAAALLTGTWSRAHGEPPMPVDAVLVGTAAMATAEATASPQVKQLLARTPGTSAPISRRSSAGGIYSGLSTLDADIHTIDNDAARCAELLSEVAGDPAAVDARREEIVAALARTAKPYFGDVDRMTYAGVLRRYTDLCAIGRGGRYDDGAWPDPSWRDRALDLYRRSAARLSPQDRGTVDPPVATLADLDDPGAAFERFIHAHPESRHTLLHPADAVAFVAICDRPGKPVPFVTALDADVRRRYMADALWQAQDPRYPASAVFVIPGPESVAAIDRVDEPVAGLLARFEQETVRQLEARGGTPTRRHRLGDPGLAPGPLAAVAHGRAGPLATYLASPLVDGAVNPLWRLVRPGDEVITCIRSERLEAVRVTPPGGQAADAATVRLDDDTVVLEVTVPGVDGEEHATISPEQVHRPAAFVAPGVAVAAETAWTSCPDRVRAYRAVTGADHGGVPLGWAFSLAWPALVGALDIASRGSHRLLHDRNRIVAGPAWPPTAGEAGQATAKVTRSVVAAPGARIGVAAEVRCPRGLLATVEAGLLAPGLPGAAASGELEDDEPEDQLRDGGGRRHPRPRTVLVTDEDRAPEDMAPFALAGGDRNPLHRSTMAARVAGLDAPVVHGMWTAARAEALIAGSVAGGSPARVEDWQVRFTAPVAPGAPLHFEIARTGVDSGRQEIEVVVRDTGTTVAHGTALVAPPVTALVFPGQGVQRPGLGAEQRTRSRAARAVWDRADAHTRAAFGVVLSRVVDRNPDRLRLAGGDTVRHPQGVLHRTEITQPALVAQAAAQLAELQEAGALPGDLPGSGTVVAGHSAGELCALLALGVLSLETALDVAHHRGLAMQAAVPRDGSGASPYGLAAVDPSVAGLPVAGLESLADGIARAHGELLQIVNHNAAGEQYVVAGTDSTLAALERRLAPRAVHRLDGIDVPFHSQALVPAAGELRTYLGAALGPVDHRRLAGHWVPGRLGRPLSLDETPDGEDPDGRARQAVIDLLSEQVAEPVRWIEVQRALATPPEAGGCGARRQIEIGPGHSPVLSRLAPANLADTGADVEILHAERDRARILFTGAAGPEPAPEPRPESPPGPPAPEDRPVSADEAVRLLLAVQARVRPDQLDEDETLEDLFQGVSSRRNQVLIDLGRELDLGGGDGIHEIPLAGLAPEVAARAPGYRFPGAYLRDTVAAGLTRTLGAAGITRDQAARHLQETGQLGPGWVERVLATLAVETRPGDSARGGPLGRLGEEAPSDPAAGRGLLDRAAALAATDLDVDLPTPDAPHPVTRDSQHGHDADPDADPGEVLNLTAGGDEPAARLAVVDRELGPALAGEIAGSFDPGHHVAHTSIWAAVRWDLARLYHDALARRAPAPDLEVEARRLAAHAGDPALRASAVWFAGRARHLDRQDVATLLEQVAVPRDMPAGDLAGEIALVTGASPGSIAAELVRRLLQRQATVVVTTSSPTTGRRRWYRDLYHEAAAPGAELHVVPANLASFRDVDALLDWFENGGPAGGRLPSLLAPFAAATVPGTAADAGPRAEVGLRLQLLGVERLAAGAARRAGQHREPHPVSILLPLSPNHGDLGGDGPYSETKAALEVLGRRRRAEWDDWGRHARILAARIGWVRGTGLMGRHDELAPLVEERSGVRTFTATEMGGLLAEAWDRVRRHGPPGEEPDEVDLSGGLAAALPDLRELADLAGPAPDRESAASAATDAAPEPALPNLPDVPAAPRTTWRPPQLDPGEMVVIVGAAELGPCGTAATRFALELGTPLPAAAIVELAWLCGLVRFERSGSRPGWVDATTGAPVEEAAIAERYGAGVARRVGLRPLEPAGTVDPAGTQVLAPVNIDRDVTFEVLSEDEARSHVAEDPGRTVVRRDPRTGSLRVTRRAGSQVRVPRRIPHSRRVAGQLPSGLDLRRMGVPGDLLATADRMALLNLACTAEAFRHAGLTPEELLDAVHPALVANTQGAGMGGLGSVRSLFRDQLLDAPRQADRLQEALGNVVAAHAVQAFVGSYGPMVHPVAACATAAVSLEEAWDKIRAGKALAAVAGGYDDLTPEGMVGFADMGATASSDRLDALGLAPAEASRPNDARRCGFVEAQGGGAFLVVRGDVAVRLGLPVRGVLAYAASFGDGLQTSIPAPGPGVLAAGQGGPASPLGAALAAHGLDADDIAVVSKHDTSTAANDPNEADLHQRLQDALGRTQGNPLLVVSQKAVTGHAKGGAAAWQVSGALQMMETGQIPGNVNLDSVDPDLRSHDHLVHGTTTLRCAPEEPVRAALVTSLGFGHVSAVLALAHTGVFVQALPAADRDRYLARSAARRARGARDALAVRHGRAPDLRRPPAPEGRGAEAAMLLDRSGEMP